MRPLRLSVLVSALLVSPLLVDLTAQELQVPAALHRVRAFLVAAYPELEGRPIEVQTSGEGGGLTLVVTEPSASTATSRGTKQRLLNARVRLSTSAEVTSFQADGPLVQDGPNADLAKATAIALRAGQDPDAVIAARGLTFGPDRRPEVLSRLRQLKLAQRIGETRVLTVSARRVIDSAAHAFLWSIELEGARAGEAPVLYELLLEPVGGQVVSLRTK